ncbi:hypothetical protein [Pseudomonas sp. PDM22]|uniref:hypothetical protein n=1 Tax=Pseudomonas sp. PDM22 TaxID=2769287 RepID=UPI0009DA48CF|nr:hypothetical protein [Pseudomonas sp. PDM22]MBD9516231.1 hypothetical protein [Pseudomonas sp. PDM22]OQR33009.1 hypothetical protein BWR15_16285 [Pseudomonas sp. T]
MADANHTSHTAPTERRNAERFVPLDTTSQHSINPRNATLYLNADAPADALYEAAECRLRSVIELLTAMRLGDPELNPYCAISRSLLLLASDAWSLYQADYEQRVRR